MSSISNDHSSPDIDANSQKPEPRKRKRELPKFYAVRIGHEPGIYHTYQDCLKQVKKYKNGQFQSFASLVEAELYLKNGPDAASRFTTKPARFYGVRHGFAPGVYKDWPSARRQVDGFPKPRHKAFSTQSEAQAFVDGEDNPGVDRSSVKNGTLKKHKKAACNEIDENVEPGSGPMPPISEDGFDARILLNAGRESLEYKTESQRAASKMQPNGLVKDAVFKIHTDGSALNNGQHGSHAGVGVYFGPLDSRNVSESLKGPRQTNQRAELTALQRAIEIAPKDRDIEIHSDSNYAIKCVTEWFHAWRRNSWKSTSGKAVENRDIVENILTKIEARERLNSKTQFQWVKGHASDPGNIAADGLAVAAARKAKAEAGVERF